jgi:hypothetical protein
MGKMKIAVAALAAAVTLGATGTTAVHAATGDGGTAGSTTIVRPSAADDAADDAEHEAREARRTADFEAVAALLKLDVDALRARLKAGETLKQVATAQGVDVQAVIDLMVTQATARIRADITETVNNGKPERGGRGPGGRGHEGRGPGGPRGRGMDGRGMNGQAPQGVQLQQG